MAKKGSVPWNKGLTKETDNRVKIGADKLRVPKTKEAIRNST